MRAATVRRRPSSPAGDRHGRRSSGAGDQAWPVSNHVIDRPLRIWSIDGPDTIALDTLERGDPEPLRLPASTEAEVCEQLAKELVASLAHLQRVEAGYWERNWRNAHRGSGLYPENHLWDAIHGYLDLLTASRRFLNDTG